MVQRPRYLCLFAGFVSATLLLSILVSAQRWWSGNDYSQIVVRVVSGPGQPMGRDIRVELLKSGVSAGNTYTNEFGEAYFDDAVPGDYAARISGTAPIPLRENVRRFIPCPSCRVFCRFNAHDSKSDAAGLLI